MERYPEVAREVARVSVDVSDIRLLDDFRPQQAREYRPLTARGKSIPKNFIKPNT